MTNYWLLDEIVKKLAEEVEKQELKTLALIDGISEYLSQFSKEIENNSMQMDAKINQLDKRLKAMEKQIRQIIPTLD